MRRTGAQILLECLAREGVEVTVVSGGEPVTVVASAIATQIVQLPPIRARDAGFRELVDAAGRPVNEDLLIARREALLEALAAARPVGLQMVPPALAQEWPQIFHGGLWMNIHIDYGGARLPLPSGGCAHQLPGLDIHHPSSLIRA